MTEIVDKIEINDKDFKRILISNYSKAGYTEIEKIDEHLAKFNINKEMLRKKMTINAIWNQFIYDKYASNIKIDTEKLKQDIFLSALVRKLEARLSNSNEKSEVLANGMKDVSSEITAFIDSINERNSNGRILIDKLDQLEKEFEYLKWNFGIVD